MSPKDTFVTRAKKTLISVSTILTALLIVVGFASPILKPAAKQAIIATLDSTYVTTRSYRDDTTRQKTIVDSVFRMMRDDRQQHARTDSALRCFIRRNKPDWCS